MRPNVRRKLLDSRLLLDVIMFVVFALLMLMRVSRRGMRVFVRVRFVSSRMSVRVLRIVMRMFVRVRDFLVSMRVRMLCHLKIPFRVSKILNNEV